MRGWQGIRATAILPRTPLNSSNQTAAAHIGGIGRLAWSKSYCIPLLTTKAPAGNLRYTLARRHGEPETKRALYAVADDYNGMIHQQNRLFNALAGQLDAGAGIAASEAANARLKEMADFYRVMRGAMEDAMSCWKRGRRPR